MVLTVEEWRKIILDEVVRELVEYFKPVWALEHALSLLTWDVETYMPSLASPYRSIAIGELLKLVRKRLVSEKLRQLLDKAVERLDKLNDYEKGVVRILERLYHSNTAWTDELLARKARVLSEGFNAWKAAKEKDDYSKFKPWLKEVFSIVREYAERKGYKEHPYDALLDEFEEGLTRRDVVQLFEQLIPRLKKLIERVLSEGFYPRKHPLEGLSYNSSNMVKLVKRLLTLLGYDWRRGRIDESPHPFTEPLSINDVRITIRIPGYDPKRTISGAIHEFGHALYHMQIDPRLALTPLENAPGLGIHESQSRFWEIFIGQSLPFIKATYRLLVQYLPGFEDYDVLEVYRYMNTVRPSLVRVYADELTYHMHIYVRFRVEEMLLSGEISVEDLPEVWNNLMEENLGVKPRGVADGVLQDVHWTQCYVGYFPTYSIGSILAVQIGKKLESTIDDFWFKVESLEFRDIRGKLKELIHKYGATYPPKELMRRAIGSYVDPEVFLDYAYEKYVKLPQRLLG